MSAQDRADREQGEHELDEGELDGVAGGIDGVSGGTLGLKADPEDVRINALKSGTWKSSPSGPST